MRQAKWDRQALLCCSAWRRLYTPPRKLCRATGEGRRCPGSLEAALWGRFKRVWAVRQARRSRLMALVNVHEVIDWRNLRGRLGDHGTYRSDAGDVGNSISRIDSS